LTGKWARQTRFPEWKKLVSRRFSAVTIFRAAIPAFVAACLKISFFRFSELRHLMRRVTGADVKRHAQGTALSRHPAKWSAGYAPPVNKRFTRASVFAPWKSGNESFRVSARRA
jgi:hypothetical protein